MQIQLLMKLIQIALAGNQVTPELERIENDKIVELEV